MKTALKKKTTCWEKLIVYNIKLKRSEKAIKITIFKRKKTDLETELETKKFMMIDGTYNYLLDIKTYQYTLEAITKMNEDVSSIRIKMETLSGLTIVNMWKDDILKC